MAEYKYDSYEIFNPGARFLPSLLEWLTQFKSQRERESGLILVNKLLFLSRREILELSRVTYQKILHELLGEIIKSHRLRPFDYATAHSRLRRFVKQKCVFIGMSDGAQIDYFRRHSNEMIENDQVLTYYKIDEEEKRKLSRAKYAFLIDDMCGSGTTFLNQLRRFYDRWARFVRFKTIYYCPYVTTEKGYSRLDRHVKGAKGFARNGRKFGFQMIYGMMIPKTYSILDPQNPLFSPQERRRVAQLCRRYYDPGVETIHTRKGGNCMFGFGRTGLLLVRYNNTPNNTPSIIWHSGEYSKALFKRLARFT